jgi:hypothetical protein
MLMNICKCKWRPVLVYKDSLNNANQNDTLSFKFKVSFAIDDPTQQKSQQKINNLNLPKT